MKCLQCSASLAKNEAFCGSCGTKAPSPTDPLLGRVLLNQYVIRKKLGAGGFGAVYLADQPSMGRKAAVKVLHRRLTTNPKLVKRFHREGLAASRLDHPCAIKMYNLGETEDGLLWIAMEFLEGETLDQRLSKQGALSVHEAIEILSPICEVLYEAHEKGIIHRDLKPENIMLTPYVGEKILPKLLDFGLVGLMDDRITLSESSAVISGTPRYMAPEQWAGLQQTDARSDIYALGLIAYQCLSTRFPFRADSVPGWMEQHCSRAPADLDQSVSDRVLPVDLSRAVMKAIKKAPKERYQSALEFRDALRAAIGLRTPKPHRAPTKKPAVSQEANIKTKPIKRKDKTAKPKRFGLPVFLLLLVLLVAGVFLVGYQQKWFSLTSSTPPYKPAPITNAPPVAATSNTAPKEPPLYKNPVLQTLRIQESLELLSGAWGNDKGDIYVVGDFGRILQSADDGKTWTPLETKISGWLDAIWGNSSGEIYALGAQGVLIASKDHGNTWEIQKTNTNDDLHGIWGSSEGNDIFVTGNYGTILHSANGGASWELLPTQNSQSLYSIWGDGLGTLFAVGRNGTILKSQDNGKSWKETKSGTKESLLSIWGYDANTLFVVGDWGNILHSKDGGNTWKQQKSNTRQILREVRGVSQDEVFAVGDQGVMLHTKNGGTSWEIIDVGTKKSLWGLWSNPAGELYAVGQNNVVIRSPDQGNTWSLQFSGSTPHLNGVWGAPSGELFAVGSAGSIYMSEDKGNSWKQQESNTSNWLFAVWGSSLYDIYVIGAEGTILHSLDKGKTWTRQYEQSDNNLSGIWGMPNGKKYVVGGVGLILQTSDGGNFWQEQRQSSNTLINLWGMENTLYIVGSVGSILKSSDGGTRWETLQSGTTEDLIGIWGSSLENVYAAGTNGTILHTTDQGKTWNKLKSGTRESLHGIWGSDENNIYIVGSQGTILHTADQGKTWNLRESSTSQSLVVVWGHSPEDVYVVGFNGVFLKL